MVRIQNNFLVTIPILWTGVRPDISSKRVLTKIVQNLLKILKSNYHKNRLVFTQVDGTHSLNIEREAILAFDPVMPYTKHFFFAKNRLIVVIYLLKRERTDFKPFSNKKSILIKFGAKIRFKHVSDLFLFCLLHCIFMKITRVIINFLSIISSRRLS